ncbi:restriction endonuclease subunit S [Staphylococcus saprophyticus]|uniref:restriction endonuclease subunit S n=1 Tax=Staphylococcus saprophyticus TaxID=29385 RepID=UPI00289F273B|nr:restriction endonuclease subunit S [Staphylococcus saprophyticus]
MTNQAKNVPELRFPEFDREWEEEKIKSLFKVVSGSTPLRSKKEYFDKAEVPWVKTTDLNNNVLRITDEKISNIAVKEVNMRILPKNTLLIAMYGGFNQIGRTGVISFDSTINQAISALLDIEGKSDVKFLQAYFNFNVKKWRRVAASSRKDPNITKKDIEDFKITIPSLNEQKKLGEFFSKLDRQIELEEQKLAKLEEQKKGYMQKIFSQELRFKDEKGNTFEEWKNTNFNYFMSEPDNLEKGIDLRKDQLLTVKLGGNGVSKANINRALKMGSTVYYKRFAGQFIYGKQNFFNGAFGIVPKFLNNYYSSGDVPALNIDYSKIDSKYFINYISRKDYYKKKEAFSTGTGSKRIHEKTLLDFDIMLPSVEEQEKIGDFFSEIDNFIEKQSYKVELLKERKKGFLQKMFV